MTVFHITNKTTPIQWPRVIAYSRVGHGKNSYQLVEVFDGFDIETTNTYQIEKEFPGWHAYAYHMQVSLYTQRDQYIYLFREWDLVTWFFDQIAEHFQLEEKRHLLLWVANFSFEFQFLRKRLRWDSGEWDFFAKEAREPLKATYRGIEFRECLSITRGSLAQLAKDYCKTQKLVGDLDYSIPRNSKTPLTPQEEAYCINDVAILAEFSQYMFNTYIRDDHHIPMTATSIIIREFKEEYKNLCKARDKKLHLYPGMSDLEYTDYIQRMFPTQEEYSLYMKYLFRGGYVHANAVFAGADPVPVRMRDITSHYPARMNLSYCPRTPFKRCAWDPSLIKSKCCIIHAVFTDIRATTSHSIESKNKLLSYFCVRFDNGRVFSGKQIEVLLTELDFQIYQLFYTWKDLKILDFYTAERGKFPPFVLKVLNRKYKEKNRLKRAGLGKSQKYAITKAGVNTCYGALVKRIRLIRHIYDTKANDWTEDPVQVNFEEEKAKQLLCPYHGIWVTAAARFELLTVLYRLTRAGVIVYYMDTDSDKYQPSHKAEKIFDHYNNTIKRHRIKRGLRDPEFYDLGEFAIEEKNEDGSPKTVLFKSLGAKRYIYAVDNEIIATVAGMPKMSIKALGDSQEDIFNAFSICGFALTPEESNKLTTRYIDDYSNAMIDGVLMEEESSVALYQIPFKITVKDEYKAFIYERSNNACCL
jgi:hypothetical protein